MKEKQPISLFNLVFWIIGAFYLGAMARESIIYLLDIEIDYDWYQSNFALVQLITYLPFGLILSRATKARFSTVISALLTAFSLYLVATSSYLSAQLDDPWAYIQEYKEDAIEYFTNQVIWLLPVLIGYVFTEIIRIVTPLALKVEFISNIVNGIAEGFKWIVDFWKDKLDRLTKTSAKNINSKKKVNEVEKKKEKKDVKEKKVKKENKKSDEKKTKSKKTKKEDKKKSKKKSSKKKKK